jgi:phosphate transport system permease protein
VTVEAYAGVRRRKQTPWTVKFGDAFASKLIAVGGIGTIAAIMLVVLVLLGTAWPLFQRPAAPQWRTFDGPAFEHIGLDEHELILWGVDKSGKISVLAAGAGERLAEYPSTESEDRKVTASHLSIDRSTLVLGFSDGSYQVAELGFKYDLLNTDDLPSEVTVTEAAPVALFEGQVYQRFDGSSVRRTQFVTPEWSSAKSLGGAPISMIDYLASSSPSAQQSKSYVVAVVGDELAFGTISRKKAPIGKKFTESLVVTRCKLNSRNATGGPLSLTLLNGEEQAVVAWPNGTLDRFALAGESPQLVESASGLIGGGELTASTPLLARQTLLCGDDSGRVIGWNVLRAKELDEGSPSLTSTTDGFQLVPAHELLLSKLPIRSISSSQKHHMAAVVDAAGDTNLVFVTTNDVLLSTKGPLGEKTQLTAIDPGDDALVAIGNGKLAITPLKIAHPESSLATFFGSVWYEGYAAPQYIWQSSAGTEKAESKLSLVPLVFGTLKATLYAMLVSVPLALMAAIYTSEFLSASARSRVKPIVEMMASLPSVVLGFVAALVIAPLLQSHLMSVLTAVILVPFSFVLAGHLWNLLPLDKIVRWERGRLFALIACLPASIWFTTNLAPLLEDWLFRGDLVNWINSGAGSATGGWVLVFIPLNCCLVTFLMLGPMAEWTRAIAVRCTPRGFAIYSLLRLLVASFLIVLLALLMAMFLSGIGLDARGSVFGSYQDRNALLVGIALGFCVIPIIYTISDDALQAVPKQLRSASLGCGATPWQTTMRVVVPSAMSGLFSAIMIGLGRAVGETMVVLMAAGNTPVMDWSPFNGFRTLSATLATELPEAAKGSTHFRTLFLAALLLFVLTLIANTIAEFVRIRFRKRASQL